MEKFRVPVGFFSLLQPRRRSLSAAVKVCRLLTLFPAVDLGQVLVEHLAGAQRRHQVVKLTAVLLNGFLGPLLPLFL